MHLLALDAKRGLAVEGKLVLLVDSEASHAGTLGSGINAGAMRIIGLASWTN